jgi:uncharacterized protein
MDDFEPSADPSVTQPPSPDESSRPARGPNFQLDHTHNLFEGPDGLRAGWRIFLYVAIAVFIFFLLSVLGEIIVWRRAGFLWRDMFIEATMAASVLTSGLVMSKIENRPFSTFGLPARSAFGKQFWIGAAWGVASFSVLMLILREMGAFTLGPRLLNGERAIKFAFFWAVYFLVVGFFEEFAARGYMQFTVGNTIGFWPSAVLLSLLFGAMHSFNSGEAWLGELGAAAIGLFFCLTLRRTGSLWFAVGMHASWDWSESYLYSVPDSGAMVPGHLLQVSLHGSRWLTGGTVGPEGSVLMFVVIAFTWIIFDRIYPSRSRSLP